jgi:hypothetical protein
MKRIATAVTILLFALTVPAMADKKAEKDAKHRCSVEYKTAKKAADRLGTKQARSNAKKDAKRNYKECVARAKSLR